MKNTINLGSYLGCYRGYYSWALAAVLSFSLIGCAPKEVVPPPAPPSNVLDFGDCLIGMQHNLSLNVEAEPVEGKPGVTFMSPVVGGADRRAFRHGMTQTNIAVPPMGKTSVPIVFTPAALRTHEANLHIMVTEGKLWGPHPFSLRGQGKYRIHVGDLKIDSDVHSVESLLEFGNSFVNPANPPKHDVVVSNKGKVDRRCHVYFGDPSGEFRLKKGQSSVFTIPAGKRHTLSIEFHPKRPEDYQIPVLVEDLDNPHHRAGVVMTGTGRY